MPYSRPWPLIRLLTILFELPEKATPVCGVPAAPPTIVKPSRVTLPPVRTADLILTTPLARTVTALLMVSDAPEKSPALTQMTAPAAALLMAFWMLAPAATVFVQSLVFGLPVPSVP